jgi:hypothetical protein
LDHFIEAFDSGYITEEKRVEIRADYNNCLHLLNGYIAYLKRAKNS